MKDFLLDLKGFLSPTFGEPWGGIALVAISLLFVAFLFVMGMRYASDRYNDTLPRPFFLGLVVIALAIFTIGFQINWVAFLATLAVLAILCLWRRYWWGKEMFEIMLYAGILMLGFLVVLFVCDCSIQSRCEAVTGFVLYAVGTIVCGVVAHLGGMFAGF